MAMDIVPDTFSSWVSFLTIAGFGLLAGMNVFDRVMRKRREDLVDDRREADNVEGRLLSALKEEVGVLSRKNEAYDIKFAAMDKKIIELSTENKTLRDILAGRDTDSASYRTQGLTAMKLVNEIATVIPLMHKDIKDLYAAINKHMNNIEKAERRRK